MDKKKKKKEKKESKKRFNYSIRTKLSCITIIVITSVVLLCWIMNKTFLASFYEKSKMDKLGETYDYINRVFADYDGNGLDEATTKEIERICSVSNVNVYVFDLNNNLVSINDKTGIQYIYPDYVSREKRNYNFSKIIKYFPDKFFNNTQNEKNEKKNDNQVNNNKNVKDNKEPVNNPNDKGSESDSTLMGEFEKYSIYKVLDQRINSYEIELEGNLDNGLYVYMSSNFDSIQESVDISNKFLAYIGIIAGFIGFVVMLFVSRSFSHPILDLAHIAKRMSELDFDAHYEVKTEDEIGQLGENMNFLSDTLERTIVELKNANNELQKDIQNKIQIDEMRKEFLSNVSHELKTPLVLILGYAEGLKDNINDDEESRDFYLDVIIDESNKMNSMVKKLLDLNNIEFGENIISIERFDIVEVIKGILDSTGILIEQKDAKVIFDYEKPVYVYADEYMIEEVITNYISNALNHLDNERIIKISLVSKKDVLRVSVFNTGNTIPESELENIWIKFYKVDKARTREYGGSGVGLSIVKAIMNSHNRECGALNHEDGVEFWFELDTANIDTKQQ